MEGIEKGIWHSLKSKMRFVNVRQWLLDWITTASGFHCTILAVAIWHIWENRNNIRNGEVLPHPNRIAMVRFALIH